MSLLCRYILGLCIAASSALVPATAWAQWQFSEHKDAMTDEVTKAAIGRSAAGHVLQVYRVKGGAVWATLSIPESVFHQFAHDGPVTTRIDSNPPQEFGDRSRALAGLGLPSMWSWKPKFVSFLVWHGKDSNGRARFISELLNGDRLLVRYRRAADAPFDVEFKLDGAQAALMQALDIPATPSPDDIASAAAARQSALALDAALDRCRPLDRLASACLAEVRKCLGVADHTARAGCYAAVHERFAK